jgi:tRNA pseudouridine65 synthase
LLPILHQDDRLVAVRKPSGLLVHRSHLASDRDTCLTRVRAQLERRVYPAHRLDRGTSGVLLFALDPEAARVLGDAFAGGGVQKEYLAVVRGFVGEQGDVQDPLVEDGRAVTARTRYHRLATAELPHAVGRYATARCSLAVVQPHTGRRHQIRRHMAHLRHPVIGDATHGDLRYNRFFRETLGADRLLLHARQITVPHPDGGSVTVTSPPTPDLARLFARLGWNV